MSIKIIDSTINDLVSLHIRIQTKWGLSSAGRALPLHGRGRWFDPSQLHHYLYTNVSFMLQERVDCVTTIEGQRTDRHQQI